MATWMTPIIQSLPNLAKSMRAGEDDLAEHICSEMISWTDREIGKYQSDFVPHAYYMLVMIAHRSGDIPQAFRFAQQGINALKENEGMFWVEIRSGSGAGSNASVTQMLRNFVAMSRSTPNLPYEDPFTAFDYRQRKHDQTPSRPEDDLSGQPRGNCPRQGHPWQIPGFETSLICLKSGSFIMGDSKWDQSKSLTKATLSRGFWIGRHEVRLEDWLRLMDYNPNRVQNDPQLPVECVSWFDAMEFCRLLTEREKTAGRLPTAYVYRLPTEAEWEYAAKAGSTNSWSTGMTGANIGQYAWLSGNSGGRIHPVGKKLPNAWGLFDIFDNAGEWCFDRYGCLPGGEVTDPREPSRNDTTVMERGRVSRGSDATSNPRHLNWRSCSDPSSSGERAENHGFRLVLGPDIVGK